MKKKKLIHDDVSTADQIFELLERCAAGRLSDIVIENINPKLKPFLDKINEIVQAQANSQELWTEELTVANEELRCSVEELQSTNERLETAKEDLSERNAKLKHLSDDLLNILNGSNIPLVMLNSAGEIRRFSPAAARLFALIPADVGRSIGDLKPNFKSPDLNMLVTQVLANLTPIEIEVEDRLGHWFILQIKPYKTADHFIDGTVIALIDIHSTKLLAQAQAQAQVKLVQTSKLASLGEMSAGIAHEINNPLAIIKGSVGLLAKFANNPEKLSSKISAISTNCDRISKIILGLQKFSRSSENIKLENHSLQAIVQETLVLVDAKSKMNNTPISFDGQSNALVRCNEVEIEQVLINLINNGIDATKSQSDRWVKVSLTEESSCVVLRVTDSGSGIPLAIRDKLFEPFFTTKAVGEGTGLGLPIVKGILDEHKATIELITDCRNTCFEIRFPIAEKRKMPLNIYYLDDEEYLCENFVDYFATKDVNVTTFTDSKTAIQAIKIKPPDLLFVDYRLPGTTGDEVANALDASFPIFLITGDISAKTEYKFVQVFTKPFEESAITKIISEYIFEKNADRNILKFGAA